MLRALVFFIACFVALPSFASLPMADGWYVTKYDANGVELGPFGSAERACSAWYQSYDAAQTKVSGRTTTDLGFDGKWCRAKNSSGGSHSAVPGKRGKICTENSTQNGSSETCTCNPGYDENASNNSCVKSKVPTADELCEVLNGLYNSWYTANREGRVKGRLPLEEPHTVCMPNDPDLKMGEEGYPPPPGCKHEFTGNFSFEATDGSGWYTDGSSWGVRSGPGLACVPGLDNLPGDPDPQKPPEMKPNPPCKGTQGQVNGRDVCIDASSGRTAGVDWTSVTDAKGNTSTVKNEVECKGEKCTVTTTTKPNAGNDGGAGGGGGTTTTSTVSRDQYCANNPKSSVCRGATDESGQTRGQGNGSGSGSSGAGNGSGSGGGGDVGMPKLWEKKYPDGLSGVWSKRSAEIKSSKLAGAAIALFPNFGDGGSAPVFVVDLSFGGLWEFGSWTIDVDSRVWTVLRIFTIICALALARKLVFGG